MRAPEKHRLRDTDLFPAGGTLCAAMNDAGQFPNVRMRSRPAAKVQGQALTQLTVLIEMDGLLDEGSIQAQDA